MNRLVGQNEILAGVGFTGLLVFSRLFGIVFMLPAIAGRQVGMLSRVVICICLTTLVAPSAQSWSPVAFDGQFSVAQILLLAQEFVVGLLLGVGLQILFLGVQVAGTACQPDEWFVTRWSLQF